MRSAVDDNHKAETAPTGKKNDKKEFDEQVFGEPDRLAGTGRFFWIDRRYVRTVHGAVHGISSLLALFLANVLCFQTLILGQAPQHTSALSLAFGVSTLLSGATLLLFWNKVQSWQLSTTSRQEKGLSIKNLQHFNQGRGVIGPIVNGVLTLALYLATSRREDGENAYGSEWMATSREFAIGFSAMLLAVTLYQWSLIWAYSKVIFVAYGGIKLGLALALIFPQGDNNNGTLQGLAQAYPYAMDYLAQDVAFDVACVEFGFLWYYLYSRRLVTKTFVQAACKSYHPAMLYIWFARIQYQQWWNHLPLTMAFTPFILSSLVYMFLYKLARKLVQSLVAYNKSGTKDDHASKANNAKSANPQEAEPAEPRAASRRRSSASSILEIQDLQTQRRSSVFESVDVGLLSSLALNEEEEDDGKETNSSNEKNKED